MRDTLVRCEENAVPSAIRFLKESPVFQALETSPFRSVDFVAWEVVAEINWQAFVQQYLHAILASSDSLASSSAWMALSRDTVGNWCKNSPSEWPPSK